MKPQQLTLGQKAQWTLMVRGWHKGGERIPDGLARPPLVEPVCLLQAVSLHARADDHLKDLGFQNLSEAVEWNDAPGRTFKQVLERLDRLDRV